MQNQVVTPGRLRRAIPEHLQKADSEGRVWFVFIGHGAPYQAAENGAQITDGLLVGVGALNDTFDDFVDGSLRKTELEAMLAAGKQDQTILVLDACFSGKTPYDQNLTGTMAVIPVSVRPNLSKRDIVFTAAEHNEVANLLPGTSTRCPAFSYVLLGALRGWADRSGEGTITVADIENYTRRTLLGLQTPSAFVENSDMKQTVLVSRASEQDPGASRLIQSLINRDVSLASQEACPLQGQVRNIDTQGQCCWPGQAYSSAYGSCVGTPICPDGLALDDQGECATPKEGTKRFAQSTDPDECSSAARCTQLADDAYYGRNRSKDRQRAATLYERACQMGDGGIRACAQFGSMVQYGEGGLSKDERRALALYQRSCTDNSAWGCAGLGYYYHEGLGGLIKNIQKALPLYEPACEQGSPRGCRHLGYLYHHGHGVDQDHRRAAELYQKSCDGGNAGGCSNLGVLYRHGHGVTQDYRRAAELYEKACDDGEAQGCTNLGFLYDKGHGVRQDYRRAAELFQKACDDGNASGCINLGVLYENGHGVRQDYRRAAGLYEKACDDGEALGCTNLGVLYRDGHGVRQDYRRAAELFQKACDGGNALGCINLGVLYENGHGVRQDYRRAAELYQKACDDGYPTGYSYLGDLYENGHGVRKDIACARELYQRSCDGGDEWGCNRLRELR